MDFGVSAFLLKLFEKNWQLAVVLFVGFLAWKILSQYLPIYAERAKIRLNAERDRVTSLERQVGEYQTALTNHLSSVVPLIGDCQARLIQHGEQVGEIRSELCVARDEHQKMRDSINRIEGGMSGRAGAS